MIYIFVHLNIIIFVTDFLQEHFSFLDFGIWCGNDANLY